MPNFLDLSHPLEPGMPAYPGLPEPQFIAWLTHDDSAKRALYTPGTTFQIAKFEIGGNTGTYIDAPFHRHPTAPDLAGLPLEKLANLPGVLVNVAGANSPITPDVLQGLSLAGKAVLFYTGWVSRWGQPDGNYFSSGPFLPAETCRYLVEQGVTLVGIDCANIDDMGDKSRPAHTILLEANIPIVEHLRGLDGLDGQNFRFFAVPPAIKGGTSFPIRAFAITEE
jgi:arylformamidase